MEIDPVIVYKFLPVSWFDSGTGKMMYGINAIMNNGYFIPVNPFTTSNPIEAEIQASLLNKELNFERNN